MKLVKLAGKKVSQTKEVPGLLSCRLDYEVQGAEGRLAYTGPKFSPELWHQVMSFFRWTHGEMGSESQVRFYVNTQLGRWGAWAFPQEARTGMTAREITIQETPEQAQERFGSWGAEPSDDWLYFCTVHHHCSASAFQSGTDEANERNQDGLHITVGRMEAERHDLHARFYLQGNCFAPDMSQFWPLDPTLAAKLPGTVLDELARYEMCERTEKVFPEAWRQNVVEKARHPVAGVREDSSLLAWDELPLWLRTERALQAISHHGAVSSLSDEDLLTALKSLTENPAAGLIIEACLEHQVLPEDLLAEVQRYESEY